MNGDTRNPESDATIESAVDHLMKIRLGQLSALILLSATALTLSGIGLGYLVVTA